MKQSKRYQEASKLIDPAKIYSLDEAIDLALKTAKTKFDASVEAHFKLGIDPKKSEQLIRGSVELPHGTGKKVKIVVFASPDKKEEAKEADIFGGLELIEEIKKTQKCNFDVAISTPDFMKNLAPIAKTLGTKGLMPTPKNETVTTNLAKTIKALKAGKVNFKNDDHGNIHLLIGKASFGSNKLKDNFNIFLEGLKRLKPKEMKGTYIISATLNASMGPGIKIKI